MGYFFWVLPFRSAKAKGLTAVRRYRINVRKSTELGKNNPKNKKPQHWVRPSCTCTWWLASWQRMQSHGCKFNKVCGLCPPQLCAPAASRPWLGPHAPSTPVIHGHPVGCLVSRKAIPLFPTSSSQEVQPPLKHQCKALSPCSTRLRPCPVRSTPPWASPAPRSRTAAAPLRSSSKAVPPGLALPSHPPSPGLQGCQFSHPEIQAHHFSPRCQAVSWQGDRAQHIQHLPLCLSLSAHPRMPDLTEPLTWCLQRFWAALLSVPPQAETSYRPLTSEYNCQRIILSVSLFYLSCFVLSQPADSWLWIQAGSNTQLKSHIVLIKYFRCFPSLL